MAMLNEDVRRQIRKQLESLTNGVKLIIFTQRIECPSCAQNTELAKETASLSDLIDTEIYDLQIDKEKVQQYHIDKIPATVVEGRKDYGVRFYGAPAGYEFAALLDAIRTVSKGDSGLSKSALQRLAHLDRPVHIQVFVTPT